MDLRLRLSGRDNVNKITLTVNCRLSAMVLITILIVKDAALVRQRC